MLLTHAALVFTFLSPVASQQTCATGLPIRLVIGNCSIPGISAYGIQLGIGETVQAEVCGAVSTVSNSTLFMSRELCEDDGLKNPRISQRQCSSRRGGLIDWNDFSAFNADGQISELMTLNPSWVTLMRLEGLDPFKHALKAPLNLGGRTITTLEGVVTQGTNHSLHHIGLGGESSLLTELVDKDVITGRSWSVNVGSTSYLFPREGSLVLGGKDDNSYEGNLIYFPFNRGERPVKQRQCPLQVSTTDLTIRMTVNGTEVAPLRYNDSTVTSGFCIESYDTHLRLGPSKVNDIIRAAGIKLVNRADYPGLYNLEEGLVFPSSTELTMTMEITIENKFTVIIPSHELVNPLRGLDTDGKFAVAPEYTEIGVFRSDPLEDSAVLGKAFLSQVYLYVDWDKEKFALAKQKQRSDIAPVLTPSGPCSSSGSQGTDRKTTIGLIAGVSALAFVTLGMLAVLIWFYRRYIRNQNRDGSADPGPTPPGPAPPDVPRGGGFGQIIHAWASGRTSGRQ
ncbi:hypothetical protein OQA88_11610 [Cercophora sp. LCS_1]